MIIPKKPKKLDNSIRFVTYRTNKAGKCIPKSEFPEFGGKHELINSLYMTRHQDLKKLKEEVIKGNISPIALFIKLENMDIKDVALRMKMPLSKIKKHLTVKGFKDMKIRTLHSYTKVFDINMSDFFQFINVKDESSLKINNYLDRLIQDITIK